MSGYKELPQSEELAPGAIVLGDEHAYKGTPYSKPLRVFIHVLLLFNAGLLVANAYASASIRTSLKNILPVHDPRTLTQPDQYVGLPEASRYKTVVLRDENGNLIYPIEQRKRGDVPFAEMSHI